MTAPLVNPFLTKDIPNYNKTELPLVILYMGRQMEEIGFRNMDFIYLEPFISKYKNELVDIFLSQKLLCNVFCLSISRYLQEFIRANELTMFIQKIKSSIIVELLLKVF